MKQLLLLLFGLWAMAAQAQQVTFQEKVFRANGTNKLFSASAATRQGKIMLSGPVGGSGSWGKTVFYLLQPNLDTIWSRIGLKAEDTPQDIEQTADGGFIFGGTIYTPSGPAAYRYDMLYQKLDANGFPQWQKTIAAFGDGISNVKVMSNGDYVLGGVGGIPGKQTGFSVIRTDSQGNIIWRKGSNWSVWDALVSMDKTPSGNFITAGRTQFPVPVGHLKLWLVGANGDSLKSKQLIINGLNRHEGMRADDNCVLALSDGGFLVSGSVDSISSSTDAILGMLVKVDSNLQTVWSHVYRSNPLLWRQYAKVKELADGSIMALAYDVGYNSQPSSNKFYMHHFNSIGQIQNVYTFTSTLASNLEVFTLEALPADSSYVIGGRAYNVLTQQYGYYAAKVKLRGLPIPLGSLTVTSTSEELAKAGFTLGQSYPNPATEAAIIPYNLPNNYKQANILIRDITGREVNKYAIKKNSSSLEVNLIHFSNGLYTYTLLVDEKPIATKKLSVIR